LIISVPKYLHCIYILIRACFHAANPVPLRSLLFVVEAGVEVGEHGSGLPSNCVSGLCQWFCSAVAC